jgi:DNA-binding MarR family transcriptional regulator
MNSWELLQAHTLLYHSVMGGAGRELELLKLDVKSFFLLGALEHLKHPAELARFLLLPKPTVTFLVKRLEAAGFVKRRSVPGDLRRFELTATPEGKKALEAAKSILVTSMEERLNRLSPQEREVYTRLMAKLA